MLLIAKFEKTDRGGFIAQVPGTGWLAPDPKGAHKVPFNQPGEYQVRITWHLNNDDHFVQMVGGPDEVRKFRQQRVSELRKTIEEYFRTHNMSEEYEQVELNGVVYELSAIRFGVDRYKLSSRDASFVTKGKVEVKALGLSLYSDGPGSYVVPEVMFCGRLADQVAKVA